MSELTFTVANIAKALGIEFDGDGDCKITGIARLDSAQPGQLAFLDNPKYRKLLPQTKASAVILSHKDAKDCPCTALLSNNAYLAYARASALFVKPKSFEMGIDHSAQVGENCEIATSAHIGANCVIGNGVKVADKVVIESGCVIGDDCIIDEATHINPNVTCYANVKIGKECIFHSGVVLGADGFGFAQSPEGWVKVPQIGGITIGNRVEIGANTTVDRGALSDTIIEDGVKLDNQIQVGHNVVIGAHTIIAGCTAIAGSVTIGKQCMIGGFVCIAGHLTICDRVVLTGMTGLSKNIEEPGVYSGGVKAAKYKTWKRNAIAFSHLDEIAKTVNELKRKILE